MRIAASLSSNPRLARAALLARLWLACLAALLSWTASWTAGASPALTASLRRRRAILNLPLRTLAHFVMCLIFLRALVRIPAPQIRTPHHRRRRPPRGGLRALLRAALHQRLASANGYSLAALARIARDPEPAIAALLAAFQRGLSRRRAILPRASADALRALFTPTPALADSS